MRMNYERKKVKIKRRSTFERHASAMEMEGRASWSMERDGSEDRLANR